MTSIRIWTLESDYDAKAVQILAKKLATHLQIDSVVIQRQGKWQPPRPFKDNPTEGLRRAVKNYLKEDNCVILMVDSDGPIASQKRQEEPNSLINQAKHVAADSCFEGRVYLAWIKPELEAWLLTDCVGICCYFAASKRKQYRKNCRERITTDSAFAKLIKRCQSGNTELIVEQEEGREGAKEYLIRFSKEILSTINPNMPAKNVKREMYREALSPDIAAYIVLNDETLRRNGSFRRFGKLLEKCAR